MNGGKFFTKEEFYSSLYFSLYKNAKFIDKNTIENLLSVVLAGNNNLIIDILIYYILIYNIY